MPPCRLRDPGVLRQVADVAVQLGQAGVDLVEAVAHLRQTGDQRGRLRAGGGEAVGHLLRPVGERPAPSAASALAPATCSVPSATCPDPSARPRAGREQAGAVRDLEGAAGERAGAGRGLVQA
ncbi:hypothetical protein GCM10025868_02900 [Angustibacter aerolatus]|uniref:Uncharacterized protein n=1 Tax=Angustibacter aerolatus TaxID=1162965 RepID=A0ABQ6JCW1_9ACTN|nr:hypothetical protein GCM10025868_02900 [Angustibacter aerolatus]